MGPRLRAYEAAYCALPGRLYIDRKCICLMHERSASNWRRVCDCEFLRPFVILEVPRNFAIINDVFSLTEVAFSLTMAAHDDRLAFGCDFASTFLVEVEPALVIGSSTWHRWAIKSNSCLSDGSSLPANEICHSRNVSESSFEVKRWKSFQCIMGRFNAWRACKCFVALSESFRSSTAFSLVIVGKSNIALTWVCTTTRACCHTAPWELTTRHRN